VWGLLDFYKWPARYIGEVGVTKRKKWFRVLAVDPFSGMRVNVDRLVNGEPNPILELWGHSVVNAPGTGRLVNLIGPIKSADLLQKVNEQFVIRVVSLLVLMVADYPWIRELVAERLELDSFRGVRVDDPEMTKSVKPPELVRDVGGVAWQNKQVEQLKRPVVLPPSVESVVAGLSKVGASAQSVQLPSAAVQPASMVREVAGPDQAEAVRLLNQLGPGGKTKRGIGV